MSFFSLPDRPMPPGRPEVTSAAGRSVTLCWTQPDDDGGCKIGNYIVEYYRVRWGLSSGAALFGSIRMESGLLSQVGIYRSPDVVGVTTAKR